jgi:tetratricopeptide (TPR) repeat protein
MAVRLAEASYEHRDFDALAAYLICAQSVAEKDAPPSQFILSELYYKLGEHRQAQGDLERAFNAYAEAARLYPVVWAAPYIAMGQLYWDRGEQEQAITLLRRALASSTDTSATVFLLDILGVYWQDQGQDDMALCAYQRAVTMLDGVPPQNMTFEARQALGERVTKLRSENVVSDAFCNSVLSEP